MAIAKTGQDHLERLLPPIHFRSAPAAGSAALFDCAVKGLRLARIRVARARNVAAA